MNDTSRDADKTRERILSAAEALFAERGFAGTSISAISRLSGCSGPLILFHFQDKRSLYRAVQSAIMDRYNDFLPELVERFATLEGFLAYLIRTMFRYYERNPAMIRIANWRRLEGDNEPWPGETALHERFVDWIKQAGEQGIIRPDIHPYRALVTITGAIHVWWEYRDVILSELGQDHTPGKADAQYAEELLGMLVRGLGPNTGE